MLRHWVTVEAWIISVRQKQPSSLWYEIKGYVSHGMSGGYKLYNQFLFFVHDKSSVLKQKRETRRGKEKRFSLSDGRIDMSLAASWSSNSLKVCRCSFNIFTNWTNHVIVWIYNQLAMVSLDPYRTLFWPSRLPWRLEIRRWKKRLVGAHVPLQMSPS